MVGHRFDRCQIQDSVEYVTVGDVAESVVEVECSIAGSALRNGFSGENIDDRQRKVSSEYVIRSTIRRL